MFACVVQDREKQEALRRAAEELRYITADYAQGQDLARSQVARLQVRARALHVDSFVSFQGNLLLQYISWILISYSTLRNELWSNLLGFH